MECSHCKRVFKTNQSLNYHLTNKVCHKTDNLSCGHCKLVFSTKQRLTYHLQNKVCFRECLPTVCSRCDKQFKSNQGLKYHLKNGVCEKPRATFCDYCEKRHASAEKLRQHLLRCDQHFCGNKKWHKTRCTSEYMFTGVEHLRSLTFIRQSILRKKEIDGQLPLFDKIEGVPWENVSYWGGICPRCDCKRKEGHIFKCIQEKRDKLAKYDTEYLEMLKKK